MNKRIIFALLALSLTTIFCSFQPGGQESPTPDVNAMANATLTAMAFVTDTPIPALTLTVPATGSISGHLSYPSDFLPPMRVVAFDAANYSTYFYVDTLQNQFDYTITGLPAGVYHVVSYKIGSDTLAGGYTQMVPCGLAYGCNDHSFIDVTVTAGSTTTDINPGDWYADAGTFPPIPNPFTDLVFTSKKSFRRHLWRRFCDKIELLFYFCKYIPITEEMSRENFYFYSVNSRKQFFRLTRAFVLRDNHTNP